MSTLLLIIASVIVVSLISLLGIAAFALKKKSLNKLLIILVSFASGSMLSATFFNLLPEALESGSMNTVFSFVIFGIFLFFVVEKFVHWHHHSDYIHKPHAYTYLNLIGDGIHNFLDGMIIAAAYLTNINLGFVTTLAVLLHEIPQEIGDFGILVHGGFTRSKALFYNFLSALTAIVGSLVLYFFSINIAFSNLIVAFAAGGFIYIAAADLIPEIQKEKNAKRSVIEVVAFLAGILAIWGISFIF